MEKKTLRLISSSLNDGMHIEAGGISEAPIGVFDSGAGGLTILSMLRKELPYENYVYFGDTAFCPYGMRSTSEIIELSIRASQFLLEQRTKLIVVACNTASLIALAMLRATFSIPIVGVVPAVQAAALATEKRRIGIVATHQAVNAPYLHQLIAEFADGIQTYTLGCPDLVTLVERGEFDGPLAEKTVRQSLLPILQKDIDVIVLGCTHFPALRRVIARVVGKGVQIIDSGAALVDGTRLLLEAEALLHAVSPGRTACGELEVWCSGDPIAFRKVASKLLGHPVFVHQTQSERLTFLV